MVTEFERQYLGEFVRDEAYEKAFDAWLQYYRNTDLYDDWFCRCKSKTGHGIPSSVKEHVSCSENAKAAHKSILSDLEKVTDPEVWKAAKRDALRKHK